VLEGVGPLVEEGLVPGGTRRNESHFSAFIDVEEDVSDVRRTLLFDAQTSGGLLIAVADERAADLVAALEARSTPAAAVVGRIVGGEPGRIHVRRGA
jgi:selenide,water dikinase